MQIIFLTIGLLGLGISFIGIKWLIAATENKEVIRFKLIDKKKNFQLNKKGLYSIHFIGGGFAKSKKNFEVELLNTQTLQQILIKENALKFRSRENWKTIIEFYNFTINEIGNYSIEFKNIENLTIKKSMLKTINLFQGKLKTDKIEILIKETIPNTKKLFGIIFTVIGLNMSIFGILMFFIK